jgi:aspartyl protease family protein
MARKNQYWVLALLGLSISAVLAQVRSYIIYDGQKYGQDKIESAVNSPVISALPRVLPNGDYFISRSADGHYYMPGFVNGHPVVFLVDSGASFSVIPARLARNAGIRAAVMETVETAGGQVRTGISSGNQLVVGTFTVASANIGVQDNLPLPVLGVDVLNRFQVTYAGGTMTVRPAR